MINIGKCPAKISEAEAQEYLKIFMDMHPFERSGTLNIELDGEFVDLWLETPQKVPFQRIRRITGYLVGGLGRWNNAKLHELSDREKHFHA